MRAMLARNSSVAILNQRPHRNQPLALPVLYSHQFATARHNRHKTKLAHSPTWRMLIKAKKD
jgi:hypothetical protein